MRLLCQISTLSSLKPVSYPGSYSYFGSLNSARPRKPSRAPAEPRSAPHASWHGPATSGAVGAGRWGQDWISPARSGQSCMPLVGPHPPPATFLAAPVVTPARDSSRASPSMGPGGRAAGRHRRRRRGRRDPHLGACHITWAGTASNNPKASMVGWGAHERRGASGMRHARARRAGAPAPTRLMPQPTTQPYYASTQPYNCPVPTPPQASRHGSLREFRARIRGRHAHRWRGIPFQSHPFGQRRHRL